MKIRISKNERSRLLLATGTLGAFLTVMAVGCTRPDNIVNGANAQPVDARVAASAPQAPTAVDQNASAPESTQANATPIFSDAADPSGLAHDFMGSIVAIGYGADVNVDLTLEILVMGALSDSMGKVEGASFKDAYKGATVLSIENGTTTWKGRTLPSAITLVEVDTINRGAGTYGHTCIAFAGQQDQEFDVIRAPLYTYCGGKYEADGRRKIAAWKQSVGFVSTQSYQFAQLTPDAPTDASANADVASAASATDPAPSAGTDGQPASAAQ